MVKAADTGLFITLEGGEGVGKTTLMTALADWLGSQGRAVVCTREPGGTPLAEQLRDVLLSRDTGALDSQAELLMMFASRAQHLAELIRPSLAAGNIVLCDRFTDATYAYQGGGRELGNRDIARLEDLVHGDLQPDLTVLLDLPVTEGLERAGKRSEPDRFESEDLQFFDRVRTAYLDRAEAHPQRIVVVDAAASPGDVLNQVKTILNERLGV